MAGGGKFFDACDPGHIAVAAALLGSLHGYERPHTQENARAESRLPPRPGDPQRHAALAAAPL